MTLILLLSLSLTAAAEGLNATLTFASPAESGRGRVQVEITSPEIAASLGATPTPDRFRAVVGRGDARIDRVQHVGSSGETIHTAGRKYVRKWMERATDTYTGSAGSNRKSA